ncbi:response regulator [Asticcacaulis sp. BYS171W]|uniref:Response regulator n=1 Tax=Asticcacaulis aquaticus TaxID=2984212 RepID=A0ABT5HU38_9CAUL|nr:response regulator [Asticcacaulis aquaticus]MDC7683549.1 response regulator [Asticcacaulis aquaticus]
MSLDAAKASRILLVEDNPANRLVAGILLERLGYAYDAAEDGEEAVKAFETGAYDIILMDLQMPVMDGYEATRRIRQYERVSRNRPVKIVALTAHALSGDRDACLAAGMDDYMSKPFKPDELQAKLDALTSA